MQTLIPSAVTSANMEFCNSFTRHLMHNSQHQWPVLEPPDTRRTFRFTPVPVRQSVVTSALFGFGGSKSKTSGKGCSNCLGKGAVECTGCKGSGKNKKNGNLFERWKCYDCQGFGLISCPKCGTGGLTPEQRGER